MVGLLVTQPLQWFDPSVEGRTDERWDPGKSLEAEPAPPLLTRRRHRLGGARSSVGSQAPELLGYLPAIAEIERIKGHPPSVYRRDILGPAKETLELLRACGTLSEPSLVSPGED